jgi:class 3 adenylate cyclase
MVTASQHIAAVPAQFRTLGSRAVRRVGRWIRKSNKPLTVIFVALDISGFGRRSASDQAELRRRLYGGVKILRRSIGYPITFGVRDRGDGLLVLLPGTVDTLRVLEDGLPALARKVDEDNRSKPLCDPMKLRCVIHKGPASRDQWDWMGDEVNLVFRLIDSETLRKAQHEEKRTPLVVAMTNVIYDEALRKLGKDEQRLHNLIKRFWDRELGERDFKVKETERTAWVAAVGGQQGSATGQQT